MSENSSENPGSFGAGLDRVWDRQRLLTRYGGDMETVFDLREDLPSKIVRLNMAAAGGDLETLVAIAHSVKGICGTMAAGPCQALALEMEIAARGGDLSASRNTLAKLLVCLDKLLDEMPN